MTANITIAKGALSVTVETTNIDENYSKKLSPIRPAQSKQKQDTGPKTVKMIDLMMVTHTLLVRGIITPTASKTAKEVKDDLINILKGASVAGTHATVTYDGDSFNMFIEKLVIIEKATDYAPTDDAAEKSDFQQIGKYDVSITLVEGTSI